MKKEYIKPVVVGERFVASEYVAACVVGKCDIWSLFIYKWDDKDKDGAYDEGEKGERVAWNRECSSVDFQSVTGELKDVTPVVCFYATVAGKDVGTSVGWQFTGMGPYGQSTHVSSIKPYSSNAS